tara:strand:- start:187 stop:504 length:318 start_codon:yes stop_codon:yes gene_type:complete
MPDSNTSAALADALSAAYGVTAPLEGGRVDTAPTPYEAFANLYRATFAAMMSYSLTQAGSDIYCEKLAALSDAHPTWAELVEEDDAYAHRTRRRQLSRTDLKGTP